MSEAPNSEEKHWYVLHYIRRGGSASPQKAIDDFNRAKRKIELFAPVVRPASVVDGQVVYKEQLLTYFYVFVNGTLDDVKELCAKPGSSLSMLLARGSEKRYATVSDADMQSFKIIARVYTNTIPFYNIEDIDLQEGDVVEVVGGQYAGLRGTFMPKPRSTKGNLVISATAALGAVVWDIDAKYVRILQFARDTRRQYDLLDAFIPKLYPILRKFHAEESLNDRDKSLLAIFNSRMCAVAPDNQKVEAKLLATLMCVQTILGDTAAYNQTAKRYAKLQSAVTNPWTQSLIGLMLSVARNDKPGLTKAYRFINSAPANPAKSQSRLLAELRYYAAANLPR